MEQLTAFLDYRIEIWGLIFPEVVLYSMALVLIVSILRSTVRAIFPREQTVDVLVHQDVVFSTCTSCGWTGELPRRHRVCPKCGQGNFVE